LGAVLTSAYVNLSQTGILLAGEIKAKIKIVKNYPSGPRNGTVSPSISPENRYLNVITMAAYFDESSGENCFSIAGYVAGYATWIDIDWRWRDLLKKWEIKYFKASECETLVGQFLKYRTDPAHPRAAGG
jgi:hypothetical protein